VLNHKVFGGKQFGELGLDFVIDGHWFSFWMNPLYKRTSLFGGGAVTLLELGQSCLCLSECLRFKFPLLILLGVMVAIRDLHCSVCL
jgi:hypothetical protein